MFERIEASPAGRKRKLASAASFSTTICVEVRLPACSARFPQLSLSTQPSTRTSLRAWSLAARQRQYCSPQPSQPVSASLCAAEACGSRVILCTAQLVRVHLPLMVSVSLDCVYCTWSAALFCVLFCSGRSERATYYNEPPHAGSHRELSGPRRQWNRSPRLDACVVPRRRLRWCAMRVNLKICPSLVLEAPLSCCATRTQVWQQRRTEVRKRGKPTLRKNGK